MAWDLIPIAALNWGCAVLYVLSAVRWKERRWTNVILASLWAAAATVWTYLVVMGK